MRTTQFFGLSQESQDFLELHAIKTQKFCPHCNKVITENLIGTKTGEMVSGMYDEEIPLYQYKLKDGRTAVETHQETIWSSGPCIYTYLKISDGTEIGKWDQKIIDNS